MKSGFALRKKLKVAMYIFCPIICSVKKLFLTSVFISAKVLCCF